MKSLAVLLAVVSACVASEAGQGDDATLVVAITGAGSVTANGVALACEGGTCSVTAASGTAVTLVATSAAGSTFAGWTGACEGAAATCTVALAAGATTTATFVDVLPPGSVPLIVTLEGGGRGGVASQGIACATGGPTAGCTTLLRPDSEFWLTATPAPGSLFVGWRGGCAGDQASCTGGIGEVALAVAARFEPDTESLTAVVVGRGGVTGGGLACDGGTCTASLPYGASAKLTATPAAGWRFDGWDDAACATSPTCIVTLDGAVVATATFVPIGDTLSVTATGAGSGRVVATSSACTGGTCLDCPAVACTATIDQGASVALVATADAGSQFVGWSGACAGATGTCTIAIAGMAAVQARFEIPEPLTIAVTGAGTVRSTNGAIACGQGATACAATVPSNTAVALYATPSATSRFVGWSGACTGDESCVVTVRDAAAVTATFATLQGTLSLVMPSFLVGGIGGALAYDASVLHGSVVATGADGATLFTCDRSGSGTCAVTLPVGSQVTLTATAASGATFAWGGYAGACSGSAPSCTVTLPATTTEVDAVFAPVAISALTVLGAGGGASIAMYRGEELLDTCLFGTCTYYVETGTTVDLWASSGFGGDSFFAGWSGACGGDGDICSGLPITGDTVVEAEFEAIPLPDE